LIINYSYQYQSIIQDDDIRRRMIDRRRSTTVPSEVRLGVWQVVIMATMMRVVGGMTLAMTGDGRGHLMAAMTKTSTMKSIPGVEAC
jgi:hypothetical protein